MAAWTPRFARLVENKEVRQFVEELERTGEWVGRLTTKRHLKLMHCCGRGIIVSGTPSDGRRAMRNARAQARRITQNYETERRP